MSMRNLSCEEKEEWDRGMDITALDEESDEKVLLRIVKSKSSSGFIGVDAVSEMLKVMEREDYDKGILLGNKFTAAAKRQLLENDIRRISDNHTPSFKPENLYLKINNCVNDLCKAICKKIPKKESDCKGDCRIRTISDNASFHFEHGWMKLMKNDLKQLLAIRDSKKSK
jgi:hypothetical protein